MAYISKTWQDSEIITAEKLNNIEVGIQEALAQTTTIEQTAADTISQVNTLRNEILSDLTDMGSTLDSFEDTINNSVNTTLTTNSNKVLALFQTILGSDYYNVNSLDWVLPNNKQTVNARITTLYNEIFGQNGTPGNESISERISTLETSLNSLSSTTTTDISTLYTRAKTALGSTYYDIDTANWSLGNKKSVDARLSELYEAIYGQSDSSSSTSILDQITALNTAIFGAGASSSDTSLTDKIEKAMGRTLDLGSGETADANTGEYSKSLMTLIRQLQGSTSNLVANIEQIIEDIYGEGNSPSPLTYPVTTLENDFYSIQALNENGTQITQSASQWISSFASAIAAIKASNQTISSAFEEYEDAIERSTQAYIAAELDDSDSDTNYLVLKRDLEDSSTDTRIPLPAGGGGGGGITYEHTAKFINVTHPTNSIINIGDDCIVTFTWQLYEDETPINNLAGNLVLRVNNSVYLTQVISSGTPVQINLGNYITATGRNTVAISVATDTAFTKTLYESITAYNAILSSTFNPETIQTGSFISFPYLASIGSSTIIKTLHVTINGVAQTLTNNTTNIEQQNTVTFATPSAPGDYLVQVYFTAEIDNNLTITSNTLTYGIFCGVSTTTRIASDFINGTSIEQYNNLQINYRVFTLNQETSPVEIYINDDAEPSYSSSGVTSAYRTWSYQVLQPSGTTLTIRIVSGSAQKVLTANVISSSSVPDGAFALNESGLVLYLTADQKTNESSTAREWTNSSSAIEAVDAQVDLNNFLFYNTIDGWQQDSDGAYFLRLRNQANVVINYPLFSFATSGNNITSGLTFELDFKTEDVADSAAIICKCFEGLVFSTELDKYITLTPQSAYFKNTKELSTQYKEEEKITIDFVINPSNLNTKANRLIYIYMNGILSAAIPYEENANLNFNDTNLNTSISKIILGSPECTLDIYSVKIYNRALSYQEIISNWINNTGNFEEKIARYLRNDYSNGGLTIENFINNSPTTPYMIITGDGPLEGANPYMPQQKGSENKKTVNVRYVNPVNTKFNFSANSLYNQELFTGVAEAQVQGTSSQAYYRKNYKIKLTSFTQEGVLHKKKLTDDDYNITTDGQGNEVKTLKPNVIKQGYKLSDTSYPTYTFCIKADVASSESVNNTGLTQIYDSAIRNFVLTPPQYDDARIRQGVEGYPMVVWYINGQNNEETLLGRYNFNNDKGTAEVYGLESDLDLDADFGDREFDIENGIYDESWEVKNNLAGPQQFEVPGAANSQERENAWFGVTTTVNNNPDGTTTESYAYNWSSSFESRFPDQDDEGIAVVADTNSDAYAYMVKRLSGLREMIEWVNDTVVWTDANKNSITPASATAFKNGLANYFNVNALLFFYVFTELFLMVDNRAKNMFWTRYQYRPGIRPTTADYPYATTTLAPDNNNYFGWFTFPYDFDTAIGTNNQGKNVYDYHWESLDVSGPDGSDIFGGQHSKLWVALRQAYSGEIETMYRNMRNTINYSTVESLFEANQSIWSETIVNEDMIVKYINWGTAIGYDMLLGLKDMQRKWWLYNRFKYFNSKFATERGSDKINIRIHVNNASIPVQVYADSYVSVSVGADTATPQAITRVLRGQTGYLNVGSADASAVDSSGIETFISPATSLKSIMNLSSFNLSSADFSNAIRLQSLQIGTYNKEAPNTRFRNFIMDPKNAEGVPTTPLLRHLDLRNCSALSGNLGLSACIFLNRIYLAGTSFTSVSLPNGGVLETIQYPETITDIVIQNQPYLENIIIGDALPQSEIANEEIGITPEFNGTNDYSDISVLYLSNIGSNVDSLAIVEDMQSNANLYLDNINWEISGTDFATIYPKISAMKGFDGITPNNDVMSDIRGNLNLTSSLPATLTLATIAERFPHLSITLNGNPYYTVNFYNFANEIIETQIIAGGQSAIDNSAALIDSGRLVRIISIDGKTRQGFLQWDKSLRNISQSLDVYPQAITEYRVDFIVDNQNYELDIPAPYTISDFFRLEAEVTINYSALPVFTRNYNDYTPGYLQNEDGTQFSGTMPSAAPADVITLLVAYNQTPHVYQIRILNTDENGIADTTTPIAVLKGVVNTSPAVYEDPNDPTTRIGNSISYQSLRQYLTDVNVAMINSGEAGTAWATRRYQFLNWSPYIADGGIIMVTGNMDIKLLYYDKNDYFTNYFVNKMTTCTFNSSDNVTTLPYGAFTHNSILEKLDCYATTIKDYGFSNFTTSVANNRIFIFNAENEEVNLGRYCFYNINSATIVIKSARQVTMDRGCFTGAKKCTLVLLNSPYAIRGNADFNDFFSQSGENQNRIFVTQSAKNEYINGDTLIPAGLKGIYADSIQLISAWEGLDE